MLWCYPSLSVYYVLCILSIIGEQYIRQVENDNFHYSIDYYTVGYLMNYTSLISFAIFIYYTEL